MKTINGITYAQLHNLSTEELNDFQAVFAANQVRLAMIGAGFPKEVEDKISEKFMPIATKRMAEVFQLHLTDRHYAAQRILYDTEERFDLAADMMVEMGNASAISSQMMQLIHEDLAKDL